MDSSVTTFPQNDNVGLIFNSETVELLSHSEPIGEESKLDLVGAIHELPLRDLGYSCWDLVMINVE